jgi:hypothetical protein
MVTYAAYSGLGYLTKSTSSLWKNKREEGFANFNVYCYIDYNI